MKKNIAPKNTDAVEAKQNMLSQVGRQIMIASIALNKQSAANPSTAKTIAEFIGRDTKTVNAALKTLVKNDYVTVVATDSGNAVAVDDKGFRALEWAELAEGGFRPVTKEDSDITGIPHLLPKKVAEADVAAAAVQETQKAEAVKAVEKVTVPRTAPTELGRLVLLGIIKENHGACGEGHKPNGYAAADVAGIGSVTGKKVPAVKGAMAQLAQDGFITADANADSGVDMPPAANVTVEGFTALGWKQAEGEEYFYPTKAKDAEFTGVEHRPVVKPVVEAAPKAPRRAQATGKYVVVVSSSNAGTGATTKVEKQHNERCNALQHAFIEAMKLNGREYTETEETLVINGSSDNDTRVKITLNLYSL